MTQLATRARVLPTDEAIRRETIRYRVASAIAFVVVLALLTAPMVAIAYLGSL